MNTAKVKKRIKSLNKLKEIIEISKFDTLNQLQSEKKVIDITMERAGVAKDIIEYAYKKLNFKSNIDNKRVKGQVYIFVTIEKKLLDLSYAKYEAMLLKDFDPENDLLIAFGTIAIEFAKKHNIQTIYEVVDYENHFREAAAIISSINHGTERYGVQVIANSKYVTDKPLVITPLSKSEIKYNKVKFSDDLKLFPTPIILVNNLVELFVINTISGIVRESKYLYLQQKLIRHEASLKNVDKRLETQQRSFKKEMRKQETEDLLLITARRGDDV